MDIIIFTDGASRGNPGPGGWAGIVCAGDDVREVGGREEHTTNNRMELRAAIESLRHIPHNATHVQIFTDSRYLINGITKWVFGWSKNGWQTAAKEEVVNKDLWMELLSLTQSKTINWNYVGGHVGIEGNERCDVIATSFADNKAIVLYSGDKAHYGINLSVKADSFKEKNKSASKNRNKEKAYSYVSSVDGKTEVHQSWPECEARVKGKSGARFKKVFSQEEEQQLVDEWNKK